MLFKLISCAFLISHVIGIKGEILNYLSLLSTFQTLKIIGFIHNTSGGSFFYLFVFFFLQIYMFGQIYCASPEESSTRLVDNHELGGKYNTYHIVHIWKKNTA